MSDGRRWLPWLRTYPGFGSETIADRVWVPVADALEIFDGLGAATLREALAAILDEAAPLAERRDDQGGDRDQ
jgi:hypothetical protein